MAWGIVALFGLISIVGTIIAMIDHARRHRRSPLRRRPRAALASIVEGAAVRVGGKVACAEPLTAPYTGRPCVYYRVELHWDAGADLVDREHDRRVDFTIAEDAAVAQVLVERARFEIVADLVEMGRASELTAKARALLAQLGWTVPTVARVELCEAVVEVGQPIEIAGAATCEPDLRASPAERGFRDAQPPARVFSGEPTVLGERRERRWLGASAAR